MTTTLLPSRNATIDAAHSSVSFVARHLVVSSVRGVFTEVSGTITIDDNDFQQALTRESKPDSIRTNVADRDAHLRSADFLHSESHPTISFQATRITPESAKIFRADGTLTIRGISRPVTLAP